MTPPADPEARRFLRVFSFTVLAVAALAMAFNRYGYTLMTDPANQTIVQMTGGWSRVYKPILVDYFDPEVLVFGASWARDAFDPQAMEQFTGKRWFNHAVTGATSYEVRRFVESAADVDSVTTVVLNLDTFLVPGREIRRKAGFDETLLDQDAAGQPTRWLDARRWLAVTLSGSAIGNNVEVLAAIRARDAGKPQSEYLESFDRFRYAGHESAAAAVRARLATGLDDALDTTPLADLPEPPGLPDLERALAVLCRKPVDIHGYFTPTLVLLGDTRRGLAAQLHGLRLMRKMQPHCRARLHFHNFNEVNALTLDGIHGETGESEWFREDGHPRPTIGPLMAAAMFGVPLTDSPDLSLGPDFGSELFADPDAERRLRRNAHQLQSLFAVLPTAKAT